MRAKIDEIQRAKQRVNETSDLQDNVAREKQEFERLNQEYKASLQRRAAAELYINSQVQATTIQAPVW